MYGEEGNHSPLAVSVCLFWRAGRQVYLTVCKPDVGVLQRLPTPSSSYAAVPLTPTALSSNSHRCHQTTIYRRIHPIHTPPHCMHSYHSPSSPFHSYHQNLPDHIVSVECRSMWVFQKTTSLTHSKLVLLLVISQYNNSV